MTDIVELFDAPSTTSVRLAFFPQPARDIPMERVIGGPAFRDSASDRLLQMAGLIAHSLLKQEDEPSPRVDREGIAQGILDRVLNRRASRRDQQAVVRR